MAKYFGTDGIRGSFGDPTMCPAFAFRLANALAKYLKQSSRGDELSVVIGRDTRASGQVLVEALVAGLTQQSVTVYDGGVVPTPAVAGSVLQNKADLGIAVTASHNPSHDNGIKLFDSSGCKLDESEECLLEQLIDAEPSAPDPLPVGQSRKLDVTTAYIESFQAVLPPKSLGGWKVVLDTANGATFQTSPVVIKAWGAELYVIGDQPDGTNINDGVGSEYPDQLGRTVREQGADIGIAHDGDGDRLVVCDETGAIIDGDVLLALLAINAMHSGDLKAQTLIATVHSNLGLDRAVSKVGAEVERVDVGDRNVAKRMRELGASIGGESSGHIIFSDYATTGDGLLAAVKVFELMLQTGRRLSDLSKDVTLFPQASKNLKVEEKLPFGNLPTLAEAIRGVEDDFGHDGRVLIRYSGTEPKLRMLAEGMDPRLVDQAISKLEDAARIDLSVIDS